VATKRLDLVREIVGQESRIAVLFNPENPPGLAEGRAVLEGAEAMGQPLQLLRASTSGQIDDAFTIIEQQRIGAMIVSPDPLFFSERGRSEEHTSELQSQSNLVCRLLLEKKKKKSK